MRRRWRQGRRSRAAETNHRGAELQPVLGDTLLFNLLRGIRSNPDGARGPLMVCFMAMAVAKNARGWGPEHRGTVERHELEEWTQAILIFLVSMALDLDVREPQVSRDARWALRQVGQTANELCDMSAADYAQFATSLWAGLELGSGATISRE